MVRLFLPFLALGLLSACNSPEADWVNKCEGHGMKRELCDCLVKRLPPERRATYFKPLEEFGGGWVLEKGQTDMAPALSCFDVGTSTG